MGLPGGGRSRSRSGDSATLRFSDGTNTTTLFLPGSSHVYLTKTHDGKPALGRKKPERDYGFDILSQTFGIPSRREYERRARRLSIKSQSSGLITAPPTPQRGRSRRRADENSDPDTYEDDELAVVRRKPSRTRRSSTPIPRDMSRRGLRGISAPHQSAAMSASKAPFPRPLGYIPPPPPPPPPGVDWHNNLMAHNNGTSLPMNYSDMTYQSAHTPVPFQGAPFPGAFAGTQNWTNVQHHGASQPPNPLGIYQYQAPNMPPIANQQQFNVAQPAYPFYIRTASNAPPVNLPPAPPPPPPPPSREWLEAYAIATGRVKPTTQTKERDRSARKVEQLDGDKNLFRPKESAQNRAASNVDMDEIGKRIRHVHVCTGCGKKRSRGYHRDNPLKRGEIPALSYCNRCVRHAGDGGFDSDISNGTSLRKYSTNDPIPSWSTDEGRAISSGDYIYKQTRQGHRWAKRPNRFSFFSRFFSRGASPNNVFPSSRSISSAEESKSRMSSPVSDFNMPFIVPRTSARHRKPEADYCGVQMEKMTPASPPQGFAPIHAPNLNTKSPLMPRDTANGGIKEDFNAWTPVRNVQGHGQRRSRIPRTRPRPRPSPQARSSAKPIDGDISYAEDAEIPAPTIDEERNTVLEPAIGTEAIQTPQPLGQVTYLEPSNRETSADTPVPIKGTQTRGYNNERASMTPMPPAARTKPVNTSSALDGNVKPRRARAHKIAVAESSEPALEEDSKGATTQFDRWSYLSESRVPNKQSREVKPERPASPRPFTSHEDYEPGLPHGVTSGVHGSRNSFFNQDEPSTPTDLPYAGAFHTPYVIISDSWLEDQSDMEREAEERAERDLAAAGKLFDDFGSTLGGSATSAFPLSSFVTTSNMSIVSYDSDSESDPGDANGTELRPMPQIEFSSEIERQLKTEAPHTPAKPMSVHSNHLTGDAGSNLKFSTPRKNELYDHTDNKENSGGIHDEEIGYSPSTIGSSLVGHTGHSADELVLYPNAQKPAATGSGHLHHPYTRLPSARSSDL